MAEHMKRPELIKFLKSKNVKGNISRLRKKDLLNLVVQQTKNKESKIPRAIHKPQSNISTSIDIPKDSIDLGKLIINIYNGGNPNMPLPIEVVRNANISNHLPKQQKDEIVKLVKKHHPEELKKHIANAPIVDISRSPNVATADFKKKLEALYGNMAEGVKKINK